MRRSTALLAAGLVLAAGLGVSSAQTGQTASPPATSGSQRPEGSRVGSRNAVGKVKSATADTLVVTGRSKGKDTSWTFALDAGTTIRKEGKSATAAELKEGDGVQVRYRTEDGKNIAAVVLARIDRGAEAKPADNPAAKPADKPAEKKQ